MRHNPLALEELHTAFRVLVSRRGGDNVCDYLRFIKTRPRKKIFADTHGLRLL